MRPPVPCPRGDGPHVSLSLWKVEPFAKCHSSYDSVSANHIDCSTVSQGCSSPKEMIVSLLVSENDVSRTDAASHPGFWPPKIDL